MSLDGFNFFLNNNFGYGESPSNSEPVQYVNFSSGHNVYNTGQFFYSGVAIGPSGSAEHAFTGKFDGFSYIDIIGESNFYAPNWTMFFVFEKTGVQSSTIFSNYQETSGQKSGFVLGVNSANKLFVETYNENGPAIYESNVNLSSKNAVALSKNSNNLVLDYFNFNTKKLLSSSFVLSPNSMLRSDDWYIGGAPNPPNYFSGNNFKGYIDSFIYLTGTYFPYEITSLFNGFTLSKAPEYFYTILDESCFYSYDNLSGEINSITFDNVNSLSYLVQTGYLLNKTGKIVANITGNILSGSGIASGRITGFVNTGSGYDNTWYENYTGVPTVETIVNGMRLFKSSIPTGVSGVYFPFPDRFSGEPVVFTELYSPTGYVGHEISGVTTSGFFINMSQSLNDTGSLTILAAPPQNNPEFKIGYSELAPYADYQFINFPTNFDSPPKVYCSLRNDIEPTTLDYYVSSSTVSGFSLKLTNAITTEDYKINYLATNLNLEDSFKVRQDVLTSGTVSQFVYFDSPFSGNPLVFGQLVNISGEEIYSHKITASSNGFLVSFSNPISSNNYRFNSIAWSGEASMAEYLNVTVSGRMYLGQLTDEAANIYNLSGYGVSTVTIPYDLALTKTVLTSGVITHPDSGVTILTIPIDLPVNYSVMLNSGQEASFTHRVDYENKGSNYLTVNHTVFYNSQAIQPDPFYIYKFCNQQMGLKLEDFSYNTGYIKEFGMDGFAYIGEENQSDFSDLIIFTNSHNKFNVNKNADVDRIYSSYFLDDIYKLNEVNLFENGVGLFGSGFSHSGQYNEFLKLSGDFALSGSNAIPFNQPDEDEDIVYDIISGSRDFYRLPQSYKSISGNLYIDKFDTFTKDLYLNGVKLSSGIDYFRETANGMDLVRINGETASIGGRMFTLPLGVEPKIRYTGYFNGTKTERFARDTSMLWSNGVRRKLNEDYIEVSQYSLLTGDRVKKEDSFVIFDNNTEFWE